MSISIQIQLEEFMTEEAENQACQSSLYAVIQSAYEQTIRPHLPAATIEASGVTVKRGKILDLTLPDTIEYEAALLEALTAAVEPTDHVVIIGGGWGVSSVMAAEQACSVTVFEGGTEQVEQIRETHRLNDVDNVTVRHAVVGSPVDVWGSDEDAKRLSGAELPSCDVLSLDCEGSEIDILNALETPLPREIVVESHGWLGTPTAAVRRALEELEYCIVNEISDRADRDCYILHGVHNGS